jgi:L-fuculose-phosphate aldolase
MFEELETAREAVAAAARRLAGEGLVLGTAGNISVAVGEQLAITASGAVLETITAEQVAIVDRSGVPADGALQPSSELALHLGIYRRYGAGAVIHTHAPVATALACVLDEVPCVHYQMLLLGGAIRVAPYRTFGTPKLAEVTLAALEGKAAALMANHGAIVHSHTLEHAIEQSLLLEWACTVYYRAACIGTPRALSPEQQTAVIDAAVARNYGAAIQPGDSTTGPVTG